MSSIFRHNLSAVFRDRAYASLGVGGAAKVVGVLAAGTALTVLLLKPVPEEARAAWGGAAVASADARAVQATVAARLAAHQRRKAEDAASAVRALASSADVEKPDVEKPKIAEAKPSSENATDAAATVVESSTPTVDIAAVPMPAPRPTAADLARAESARAKAERRRLAAARARQERREMERREMAEAYPGPQAYRIGDGRMVRVYERAGQPGETRRYAARNFGPLGGLLGLFGVE